MKRTPCDTVVRGAKIFNVFTGELLSGDLGIVDGKIVGVSPSLEGERIIDAGGLIALPGFIDAHIHVESSLLSPEAFAALAVPCGTTGIVADPHEITNVCGVQGAEYVKEAFSRLSVDGQAPLDVYLQLPSCVPATPFETSGASLNLQATKEEIVRPLYLGLGEMMNFPAVLSGESEVIGKVQAALAEGKVVDGHAPSVEGDALNAYAGAGILTDHECESAEACRARIKSGMYAMLRNGSSAKNVMQNYAAIDAFNFRRFLLCSDDKNAYDLKNRGHIDDALKTLVSLGVPFGQAVCMATINVAECYNLKGKGALAPGYDADIVLVEDVCSFRARTVIKGGKIVAKDGMPTFEAEKRYLPDCVKNTVNIAPVKESDFALPLKGNRARAMRVLPYSLVTEEEIVTVQKTDGDIVVKGTELVKLAVVERHRASGNIGLGLLKDYGFSGGAMGVTVAHDSHNLVLLGDDNADMVRVVELLKQAGGGMALVRGGQEWVFPLDIAGLMSSDGVDGVIANTQRLSALAREMGVKDCYEPFMSMAFLSLVVIPKLKLTDRGLFDLQKFSFVEIEE